MSERDTLGQIEAEGEEGLRGLVGLAFALPTALLAMAYADALTGLHLLARLIDWLRSLSC